MKNLLATMLIAFTTMTSNAQPMTDYVMRNNARMLTDRMAYTLGIATHLLDDLYMINYDYIYGVNDYLDELAYGYYATDYDLILAARDAALRRLLTPYQWNRYIALDYFYRPIAFANNRWRFRIYAYDNRPNYFYYGAPVHYTSYHGGHYFAGMRPAHRPAGPGRYGYHHDHNYGHPGNYNGNHNYGGGYHNGGGHHNGGNFNGGGSHNGGHHNGGTNYNGGNHNNGGNFNGGDNHNGGGNHNAGGSHGTRSGSANNGRVGAGRR